MASLAYLLAACGESSPSSKDLNPTEADAEALAVDGNAYPDKANPEYDRIFGITTELNSAGTLVDADDAEDTAARALCERWGVEPVQISPAESEALLMPIGELTESTGRQRAGQAQVQDFEPPRP